jgi:hypothetical protein
VDINHRFTFCAQGIRRRSDGWGVRQMVSNQRFYLRRAAEERTAAQRAITPQAREWHSKLAQDFARRAIECGATAPAVAIGA